METKRKITVIITVVLFAGFIVCPALARKYDTMMVGVDRWIDTGYENVQCDQTDKIVFNKGSCEEPDKIAFEWIGNEEPNVITYDGQLEPNAITLVYYAAGQPEEPNDMNFEGLEPNLVVFSQSGEYPNSIDYEEDIEPNLMLIYLQTERPEYPNSIDYEEDIEPNRVLIYVRGEHPEEPNEITANEEESEPNDIDKIIFDEGTANSKIKSKIAKS
ncbi:MAG: hypothetical protein K9M75_01050 [Phycisphaerae bacterium]|nr:hypothetical protein [Phycisphaerae bacterium]